MPNPEVGNILNRVRGPAAPGSDPLLPPNLHAAPAAPSTSFTPPAYQPSPSSLPHPPSSPQTTNPELKRSRARSTKSCQRCRAKKLKCDRVLPCTNCTKGGRDGSECTFIYGPGIEDARVMEEGHQRGMKKFRVEKPSDQHTWDRLQAPHLEATQTESPGYGGGYNAIPSASNGTSDDNQPPPNYLTPYPAVHTPITGYGGSPVSMPTVSQSRSDVPSAPLGRIEARGSRTRYSGAGNRMEIMNHFKGSKDFIIGSFKDPQMAGMARELSIFQKTFHPNDKYIPDPGEHQADVPMDHASLQAEMLKALPSGFFFEILQARYISNWETVLRVLHIPTFMRECDEVAAIKDSDNPVLPTHIRDSLLPQILAVIAIGSRLSDLNDRGTKSEKLLDKQITKNMALVQRWLDGLHGKALITMHTLRTRALLLLAHQANLAHPLALWHESGSLVRYAMGMGLHKDPEDCTEMSKFDKEMRRKLWMTVVELDMQISVPVGMPTTVYLNGFTTNPLVNVDDHDLTEDMVDYPSNKSLTVWTNALPQIALGFSMNHRLYVTNLLGGNVNLEHDAPVFLDHARILEKALRDLPDQFKASTRTGNNSNKRLYRLFTSIMLDMTIRRPMLALYRSISLSSYSNRYPEARKGALRSALAILAHLDALDPAVADLNIVKTRDYLNLFQILCKNDILQAALIVCFEIRAFNSSSQSFEDNGFGEVPLEPLPEDSFPQTKHSLTRVVENTVNSLIQRLGEFGSDLKDVLPLSIVLQSVRSDGTPEEKRELMIRGAERVLFACRQVLPSIQDAATQQKTARSSGLAQASGPPISDIRYHQNPDQTVNPAQTRLDAIDFNMGSLLMKSKVQLSRTNKVFQIPGNSLDFDVFDLSFADWDMGPSSLYNYTVPPRF